jgi:hypothetical protein
LAGEVDIVRNARLITTGCYLVPTPVISRFILPHRHFPVSSRHGKDGWLRQLTAMLIVDPVNVSKLAILIIDPWRAQP